MFLTLPREQLTFDYERDATDPRIAHQVVLGFDEYGDTERSISVAYPRRAGYAPPEPNLAAATQGMLAYDQTRLHIAATETRYTNAIDDATAWPDDYRTPAIAATVLAELTGIAPPPAPADDGAVRPRRPGCDLEPGLDRRRRCAVRGRPRRRHRGRRRAGRDAHAADRIAKPNVLPQGRSDRGSGERPDRAEGPAQPHLRAGVHIQPALGDLRR